MNNTALDLEKRMDDLLEEANEKGYCFGFTLLRNEYREIFSDDDDFGFELCSKEKWE